MENEGTCNLSTSPNLDKLKLMTKEFSEMDDLIPSWMPLSQVANAVEVDVDTGYCVVFNLFNTDDIAVSRFYCEKDTTFIEHSHEEEEFIIIYNGSVIVNMNGKTYTANKGRSVYIRPKVIHTAYFPEKTRGIAITVPSSESFPRGPEGKDGGYL